MYIDVFLLIGLIFALIVGFLAGFKLKTLYDFAVNLQATSLINSRAGIKGREAKAEQATELQGLLMEAGALFKQAKADGEDIKDTAGRVVPYLVAKYPMVVAKHGKKLLKLVSDGGGLEALGELL